MSKWSRSKLAILLAMMLLSAAFFLTWFMQTAWLASFPGANVPGTAGRAYMQLAGVVVSLALAGYCTYLLWTKSGGK